MLRSRSHPAHGVQVRPAGRVIVFLTVCTRGRARWLACPEAHARLLGVWREAVAWRAGRNILMPDHLHVFAAPGELQTDLDRWVTYWKSRFTKANPREDQRWQPDHWDVRLRTVAAYNEKLEYMRYNPVRRGLVGTPEEWPYRGEIFPVQW